MKHNIIIFDTVYVINIALQSLLKSKYPKCDIDITTNHESLNYILQKKKYSILIIDIFNSDYINSSFFKEMKKNYPSMKNILFTENRNEIALQKCLKEGADVYLSKNSDEKKILNTVKLLFEGDNGFHKKVKLNAKKHINIKNNDKYNSNLSSREIQIASLLLKGKTITYISEILKITKSTVSTFKKRIFIKTKSNNIIELDAYFNNNKITIH
jgi:DNA-binding NarL/FixJ family response regulator